MNLRKSILVIGSVGIIGFLAFAVGELMKPHVKQVLIIDYDKRLAYTSEGKALKISEPAEDRWTHRKPVGRVAQFYVRGAETLQVDWDSMLVYADKVSEGLFECPFPIRDSDKSIHYKAIAPMGWKDILSYTPDHLPKELTIREDGDKCVVGYCAITPYSPNQPQSSYRMIIEPDQHSNSFSYITPENSTLDLCESFKGQRKDIQRIRILKQDYDVIKEGYLACGSIPSKDNTTPPNDKLEIAKIATISPNFDIQQMWKPDGTKLDHTDEPKITFGIDLSSKDYRNLAFWIRAGSKYSSDAVFKFATPTTYGYTSSSSPSHISNDCREYQLSGVFSRNLNIGSFKIGLASGPYQEIVRTKMTHSGVFKGITIEERRNKKGMLRFEDFFVSIPKQYIGQQYRVGYVDNLGRFHDRLGTMEDAKGRVGFQFQGPVSRRNEISEVIVKARPYRYFEFKNVHFYPKGAKP